MDKLTEETITATRRKHSFYCDECGTFIGDDYEDDTGWYNTIGEYEHKIFFNKKWFVLKKHLCEDCVNAVTEQITSALHGLGYKEGK